MYDLEHIEVFAELESCNFLRQQFENSRANVTRTPPSRCHDVRQRNSRWPSGVDVHSQPLRKGRVWNFSRIEYRIEYPRNFEYESNIESNTNIQWLQIRLEY